MDEWVVEVMSLFHTICQWFWEIPNKWESSTAWVLLEQCGFNIKHLKDLDFQIKMQQYDVF